MFKTSPIKHRGFRSYEECNIRFYNTDSDSDTPNVLSSIR